MQKWLKMGTFLQLMTCIDKNLGDFGFILSSKLFTGFLMVYDLSPNTDVKLQNVPCKKTQIVVILYLMAFQMIV